MGRAAEGDGDVVGGAAAAVGWMWSARGGGYVIREGESEREREDELELDVAEDAPEADVGVVDDVDLGMEVVSGVFGGDCRERVRTRVQLSAHSRSEEPGPPGQVERRSASLRSPSLESPSLESPSLGSPSSRPTRTPLGNIEAARATVERAMMKNVRKNISEERGGEAESKKKGPYEEVDRYAGRLLKGRRTRVAGTIFYTRARQ